MNKTFEVSLLMGLGYYFAWYLFRATGLQWNPDLNIPGFFILAGSYPWSYVVLEHWFEMKEVLGHVGRELLAVVLVTVGFAANITATYCLLSVVYKWLKGMSQGRRNT